MEPDTFKQENTVTVDSKSESEIHALLNVLRFNLTEIGSKAKSIERVYMSRPNPEKNKKIKDLLSSHDLLVQQMSAFESIFWEVLKK